MGLQRGQVEKTRARRVRRYDEYVVVPIRQSPSTPTSIAVGRRGRRWIHLSRPSLLKEDWLLLPLLLIIVCATVVAVIVSVLGALWPSRRALGGFSKEDVESVLVSHKILLLSKKSVFNGCSSPGLFVLLRAYLCNCKVILVRHFGYEVKLRKFHVGASRCVKVGSATTDVPLLAFLLAFLRVSRLSFLPNLMER